MDIPVLRATAGRPLADIGDAANVAIPSTLSKLVQFAPLAERNFQPLSALIAVVAILCMHGLLPRSLHLRSQRFSAR